LFSFLKKSEPDTAVAVESEQRPAPEAPDVPAAQAEPVFHPPEAWNIDSLTAPPPESSDVASQVGPPDPALTAEYQQKIIDATKTVYDPEIPVDIYELGLIYEIIVDAERKALVRMTLTSPACPSAQQLPQEVRYKVKAIDGLTDAFDEIVWEPTRTKDLRSEAAKLTLGIF
jgi:FeS assembly SUF system protein